jgi:uncharacterized cupin superfamily protein
MKLDGVVMGTAETCELNLEPINERWILSGKPVARSKVVARAKDWSSSLVVWDCTAGSFCWHYGQDEVIVIISGDLVLLHQDGTERRFSAGDYVFFPAGTVANWRVDNYIRKVAMLKEPVWRPLGFALKACNKFLRSVGLGVTILLSASSLLDAGSLLDALQWQC